MQKHIFHFKMVPVLLIISMALNVASAFATYETPH
jgi:hypothetical protein